MSDTQSVETWGLTFSFFRALCYQHELRLKSEEGGYRVQCFNSRNERRERASRTQPSRLPVVSCAWEECLALPCVILLASLAHWRGHQGGGRGRWRTRPDSSGCVSPRGAGAALGNKLPVLHDSLGFPTPAVSARENNASVLTLRNHPHCSFTPLSAAFMASPCRRAAPAPCWLHGGDGVHAYLRHPCMYFGHERFGFADYHRTEGNTVSLSPSIAIVFSICFLG